MRERKIPSKTFVVGEYAVLHGGPAIMLISEPYFSASIEEQFNATNPFHPNSTAGKFWFEYTNFQNKKIKFHDPHNAVGGFGASGAEFVTLFLEEFPGDPKDLAWDAWEIFLKKQNAKAIPPSGADIVAQCYGANSNKNQLLFIDFSKKEITPLPYFSDDIKLYILHTGIKIQTHEHLSDKIKENFPYAKLIDEVHNALNSIKQHNPTALGQVMNTYASILQKAGYMAEHTKEHLNVIQKMPGVLGAKGCGAMGSDVLLVLLKNNVREEFKKLCLSRNLRLVATI